MIEAESLPLSDRALWAALSDMRIEEPGTGRDFEAELIRETGWSAEFAGRALDEYRRFLFLIAVSTAELTPSTAVDEVWHLHLVWERHYREELCGRILGRDCRHLPGTGTPEDEARYRTQYEATLRFYEDIFSDPPPSDLWPRPFGTDGAAEHLASVPTRRRRIFLGLGLALVALACSLEANALGYGAAAVFGVLFAVFIFGVATAPSQAHAKSGHRDGGGSCGGDGGCHGGCGGSCGAACGGGCGGGCGG